VGGRVYMLPTLTESLTADPSNTIHQIVVHLASALKAYGYDFVDNIEQADLVASNAGMGQEGQVQPDIAVCHGLYPTGEPDGRCSGWHWAANRNVIADLRAARAVTVPSTWVGEILRRDMHVIPTVIPWAVDPEEWTPGDPQGYALWGKTRSDGVCDPAPVVELAKRHPGIGFLTTYGEGTPNVKTVGRLPYEEMKQWLRNAGVYIATTKETFGIMTLEAMAAGVPVLGYDWGGTSDIVEHGVTGFLAKPGDIDGLSKGLGYCLQHRAVLGANARSVASTYTWNASAAIFARLFDRLLHRHVGPKVSVVIPCHNYARYVGQAIESVLSQVGVDYELLVVQDLCTDNSAETVSAAISGKPNAVAYDTAFGNPADARNFGIEHANGEYIVCLDADDAIGNTLFLKILSEVLDKDRSVGIAFSSIRIMDADGNLGSPSQWPNGYDYDQQCQRHNQVPTCCMFRKDAWTRAGGYRRRYCPAEDADLWLRIGSLGYRAAHATTEPMFLYRLHSDSLSGEVRTDKKEEPDWVSDKPWTQNGDRPFASDGRPPRGSFPVRNYDRPLVSIVVPCAEHHRYLLPEALDSIETQTFRSWECIVVNDADTPLSLPAYPWAYVVDAPKTRNAGKARNLGIAEAKAPYIAFLDADDVFSPRFLEHTLRHFAKTGRYVYTDWVSVNKEGKAESHTCPDYDPNLIFRQVSLHSVNILIPKVDLVAVSGFAEDMPAWEDVDLMMKLAVAGICGSRLPERLVVYRYLTGSLREHGETIKGDLISLLRKRYSEYIEDKKMCKCREAPKVLNALTGDGADPKKGALVRVIYHGPPGAHAVIGASHTNYGRRSGEDIFYVHASDQAANPERFEHIPEAVVPVQETAMPPEPVAQ
jgi:glycosyltransferase involved in cell wall biosynthesis